ncbi:MAG TPA: 6-phosphofructokinase [Chitinophagaceae bacterium]|nr:6-phosphofructokinase [Chitinophagaceae bacterium]
MAKKIAILTSGGDAPGMNAAIRAVVRTAIYYNFQVFGIRRGFQGLIEDDIIELDNQTVANIIQRGGTILKTARSKEFRSKEGRKLAFENLQKREIENLIVLGGDGSFAGAMQLQKEHNQLKVIGIPCTIDKDICGTDYTIGFDTAVNTAVEAIDRIRDTAHAHDRLFIVEVMGRDAGYIALHSGIACGAEEVLIPEKATDPNLIIEKIEKDKQRKKLVRIIVVAEGDDFGGGEIVQKLIEKNFPDIEPKAIVLGHIQRGGSPNYYDRWVASHFGYYAIKYLLEGKKNFMLGKVKQEWICTPMDAIKCKESNQNLESFEMVHILSS